MRKFISGVMAALLWVGPSFAEELVVPGSGNLEHVLTVVAAAFNASQSTHHVTIPSSTGTAGALRDLDAGTAALGRVGRPLSPAERAGGLVYAPLGRDAVVFVAGAGVSVRVISSSQAVDIYKGEITDWKQLGGTPGPIRVIGRETNDASLQSIARAIKAFENIKYTAQTKVVHLDPQLIDLLDRFPTSFGFLNRSALSACTTAVIPLALDGVEPSVSNLEHGRYPLWIEVGLAYRSDRLTPAAASFIEFLRSPAGRRILREQGVLPSEAPR